MQSLKAKWGHSKKMKGIIWEEKNNGTKVQILVKWALTQTRPRDPVSSTTSTLSLSPFSLSLSLIASLSISLFLLLFYWHELIASDPHLVRSDAAIPLSSRSRQTCVLSLPHRLKLHQGWRRLVHDISERKIEKSLSSLQRDLQSVFVQILFRNGSLQRLVSGFSQSETLQTFSNGHNPSWTNLEHLLDPKRHVLIDWDMSLHKWCDPYDQDSQLFKETQWFKDCFYILFKSDRIINLF